MADDDGQPTADELTELDRFEGTPAAYADLIGALWAYPEYVTIDQRVGEDGRPVHTLTLVTGGWSGNEEILSHIERSMFHILWWHSSFRGGKHVYEVNDNMWAVPMPLGQILPA